MAFPILETAKLKSAASARKLPFSISITLLTEIPCVDAVESRCRDLEIEAESHLPHRILHSLRCQYSPSAHLGRVSITCFLKATTLKEVSVRNWHLMQLY